MNKKIKIFSIITVFILAVFFNVKNIYAEETYKIGEEIVFARNYEFEEDSYGTAKISGAYNEEIKFGNNENQEFQKNLIVTTKFIPKSIGTYKIDIQVNAKGVNGKEFSRKDTIYFIVTDDGRDMSSEEIEKLIKQSLESNTILSNDLVESEPYLTSISVKNAKLVESVVRGRREYHLEVDKNSHEISFELKASQNAKIEGIFTINPNIQNINIFSVANDKKSVSYTFKWETPKVDYFKFKDKDGEVKNLVYYYKDLEEYKGLQKETVKIKDQDYTVLKDQSGNLLLPLKEQLSAENPDLYTFTTEGDILFKFGKFINLNGQIYIQNDFKKIFQEDLRLFNLEEVNINSLNSARGYKINRVGYENIFLVRLQRPDGYEDWFQYNEKNGEIVALDLPESLFESSLAKYFGIDLETDYKKFDYSYYDLALISIAFISLMVIIYFSYREKK